MDIFRYGTADTSLNLCWGEVSVNCSWMMGQDCSTSASTANACTSWNCEALLERLYNQVKLLTDDGWSRCHYVGPWTLPIPWQWRRTLNDKLPMPLTCQRLVMWNMKPNIDLFSVHFQKLIHVPTMWTFCSYLLMDIFMWWLKQDEHSTKDIFSETQLCC